METSNEALNKVESIEQTAVFSSADETVTTLLMTKINKTETSDQAQTQDKSNGQTIAISSANETVTASLMTHNA